jgi:hypothetical protein
MYDVCVCVCTVCVCVCVVLLLLVVLYGVEQCRFVWSSVKQALEYNNRRRQYFFSIGIFYIQYTRLLVY